MKKIDVKDIDWEAYKEELEANIENEDNWAAGYIPHDPYDTWNPHAYNATAMRAEFKLLDDARYDKVLSLHDSDFWQEWLKKN